MRNHLPFILIYFVTAFSTIAAAASPLPDKAHIYVEGSATIEVEPDIATFHVSLQSEDMNAEKAKNDIDKRSTALIALCRSLSIDIQDVSASGIRVNKNYEYDDKTNRDIYTGIMVSRSIEITLRDIAQYRTVMHELVSAKISDNIYTTLSISNEKTFTDQALLAALEDATARAQSIAKIQNVTLGKVYSVSEFDLRQPERYQLRVRRTMGGQSSSSITAISAEDIGKFPDTALAESLQRTKDVNLDPFGAGAMQATAQVFVVFLVK